MRILNVVGNMNCGGVENFIMNVFNAIDHDIIFDFIYLDKKDNYFFDSEIKKKGGKIYYLDRPNCKNFFKFLLNYKKIIRMNSYKVVHSHVFYNSGFIAFLSKIFGVKKVIVHSHSTRDNKNINSFFRKIYRFSSKFLIKKFADKKLACGELAGKYLYGKSDFKIINNGIDSNRFINFNPLIVDKIKKQYNIKSNDMVIGHIGRLTEVKNHDFILKLASSLTRENDNIKFLLIGDGELKDSIEKKIKDEKIKNIVMVGNVFDIPEYLQCMSLIIMPSLYEGFPVTLVESQMSGLPFIASTNISKEVDLKVSNNVFLDLDVDSWKDYILCNNFERVSLDVCKEKLNKYDIKNVTKELKKIYMEE